MVNKTSGNAIIFKISDKITLKLTDVILMDHFIKLEKNLTQRTQEDGEKISSIIEDSAKSLYCFQLKEEFKYEEILNEIKKLGVNEYISFMKSMELYSEKINKELGKLQELQVTTT